MSAITIFAEKYNVKPNGVIHVGAHLGEEAREWSVITKRVCWVEPNPEKIKKLSDNVREFGHEVIQAAAGEAASVINFNVASNGQSSSILPLHRHSHYYPGIVYTKSIPVKVIPLDAMFYGRFSDYDYLYMDIQGYEGKALLGATKLINHLKWIYLEYNLEELYKGCWLLNDIEKWLGDRGFELREMEKLHPAWGDAFFVRKDLI